MNCPKCEMINDSPFSKPESTDRCVWVLRLLAWLLAGAKIEITQIESTDGEDSDIKKYHFLFHFHCLHWSVVRMNALMDLSY